MSTAAGLFDSASFIELLARELRTEWRSIAAAKENAHEKIRTLSKLLEGETSPDASVVVHGSLARLELTSESDLDWTLLVDGRANPQHQKDLLRIRAKLLAAGFGEPGQERTFGSLSFSHQIIHMIGGEDDSNANTTRRVLLLLEASAIGDYRLAFEAVQKNVLDRYLREDYGLGRRVGNDHPRWIPLFLLNDIARYWRTMAVDFAYKQHSRGSDGYALRSLKLGISRKLIYSSGLVSCFWCDPALSGQDPSERFKYQKTIAALSEMISITPLERMAKFYLSHSKSPGMQAAAGQFFGAYDQFLEILDAPEKRRILKTLSVEAMYDDRCFLEAREVRLRFKDAIRQTFLQEGSPLYKRIIEFGVF